MSLTELYRALQDYAMQNKRRDTFKKRTQWVLHNYLERLTNKSLNEQKDYGEWMDALERLKGISEPVEQWNRIAMYMYEIGILCKEELQEQLHDSIEEVLNEP